jgi:hypothetical protein
MIFLYFSEDERNSAELEDVEARTQIQTSIRAYNRRFSGNTFYFFPPPKKWNYLVCSTIRIRGRVLIFLQKF